MKIAVYAIALNEAAFAERFSRACAEADLVIVGDTGSTDGTQDVLRANGAIVHDIRISPWRFDDARNAALALVPHDVDVCIALDLDEVPAPGWRKRLEEGWTPGTNRGSFTSVYSHLPDGSPGVTFLQDRLHSRHGFRWRYPCHEGLYTDRIVQQQVTIADLIVDHWPDPDKSRSSYLALLETGLAEDPQAARMAYYLARELSYAGRHEEALAQFEHYLAMPNATFTAERASALVKMGECAAALGRDPSSFFYRALAEAPNSREPWLGLGEHYYRQKEWAKCYGAVMFGLAVTAPDPGFPSDPRYWGSLGNDLAAIAAWELGDKTHAIVHAQLAFELAPWDERLKANVEFMVANAGVDLAV